MPAPDLDSDSDGNQSFLSFEDDSSMRERVEMHVPASITRGGQSKSTDETLAKSAMEGQRYPEISMHLKTREQRSEGESSGEGESGESEEPQAKSGFFGSVFGKVKDMLKKEEKEKQD